MKTNKIIFLVIIYLLFVESLVAQIIPDKDIERRTESYEILGHDIAILTMISDNEFATPRNTIRFTINFPFNIFPNEDAEINCQNENLKYFSTLEHLRETGGKGYLIVNASQEYSTVDIHYNFSNPSKFLKCAIKIKMRNLASVIVSQSPSNQYIFQSHDIQNINLPENLESYYFSLKLPESYIILNFEPGTDYVDKTSNYIKWGYGQHTSFIELRNSNVY